MIISFVRTVLLYIVILLAVRLMGKRRSANYKPQNWW